MADFKKYQEDTLLEMYEWIKELRSFWLFKQNKDPQLEKSIKIIAECAKNAHTAYFIVGLMANKYRAKRAYTKAMRKYYN